MCFDERRKCILLYLSTKKEGKMYKLKKENTIVPENITKMLIERWIACYLLYDQNYFHALLSFDNNESDRLKRVPIKKDDGSLASQEMLSKAYNKILSEEIEDWIQWHMQTNQCSRKHIEEQVTQIIKEQRKLAFR